MSFQIPSYPDYMKATKFARFKYQYGIIVMVLCWLCLLFIVYYMVANGNAIATNPFLYGAKKAGVECYCYKPGNIGMEIEFYVNGSTIWQGKG